MKSVFFVFVFFLAGFLPGFSQEEKQILLKGKSLEQGLKLAESAYSVSFNYNPENLPVGLVFNENFTGNLNQFLNYISVFASLKFEITGNIILLKALEGPFILSGQIKERVSGELLPGATVYFRAGNIGCFSNNYGFYSISLPSDTVEIELSFVGYQKENLKIKLNKNTHLDLFLNQPQLLSEVSVQSTDPDQIEVDRFGRVYISSEVLKSQAGAMGEKDVLKSVQLLSGVQKPMENTFGLIVRGGGIDQNLVIIDDAPVYNTSHLLGIISVFNTDAFRNLKLSKNSISAKYGGRLSSVVDMNTKEGSRSEFHGDFGISPISTQLSFEGPIKKDKGSFFFSGRRTYLDLLVIPFIKNQEFSNFNYFFYDFNAKLNYDLGKNDRIFLSYYTGKDNFLSFDEIDGKPKEYLRIFWGNRTFSARWNHTYSERLFSNLTLIRSAYDFTTRTNFGDVDEPIINEAGSGIYDYTAKLDYTYYLNNKHTINYGAIYTRHLFVPEAVQTAGIIGSFNRYSEIRAAEFAAYVEDEIQDFYKWDISLGLRLSGFLISDEFKFNPEPRIALGRNLKKNMRLNLSYNRMAQYMYLFSQANYGIPTFYWLPIYENQKALTSDNFSLGVNHKLKWGIEYGADIYYRNIGNIIDNSRSQFVFDFISNGLNTQINGKGSKQGVGRAYGLELFFKQNIGRFEYYASYTLSRAENKFSHLNKGNYFDADQDRRHDLGLNLKFKISQKWTFNTAFVYSSGSPFTIPDVSYIAYTDPDIANGGLGTPGGISSVYFINQSKKYNQYRLPDYHRLDFSFRYAFKNKMGAGNFEFGVYNAYNQNNLFMVIQDVEDRPFGLQRRFLNKISLIPILPILSYNQNF